MIQLFEEDYALVKGGIAVGTAITSASDPITGYVDGNVYINIDTKDVFKCDGTSWVYQGNLSGIADIQQTATSMVDGGVNEVTFTLTDGRTRTFQTLNGSKGSQGVPGVSIIGAVDNGDGTFYLLLSNGQRTNDIATIQGLKGDKGDQGIQGIKGRDVSSFSTIDSGKTHVVSANYSDGTSQVVATLRDGNDGAGTGDMIKATYDPDGDGSVNLADALFDAATGTTIPAAVVQNKADKGTTLADYGITDAYNTSQTYSKAEVDTLIGGGSPISSVNPTQFDISAAKQLSIKDTLLNSKANADWVGEAYDPAHTLPNGSIGYAKGETCISGDIFWLCLSDNAIAPTDDGVHWKMVNAGALFSELNSNLSEQIIFVEKTFTIPNSGSQGIGYFGYLQISVPTFEGYEIASVTTLSVNGQYIGHVVHGDNGLWYICCYKHTALNSDFKANVKITYIKANSKKAWN